MFADSYAAEAKKSIVMNIGIIFPSKGSPHHLPTIAYRQIKHDLVLLRAYHIMLGSLAILVAMAKWEPRALTAMKLHDFVPSLTLAKLS